MKKNPIKNIVKVLLIILAVIAAGLGTLFIYNRVMTDKEAYLRVPIGQMIEIDGHDMCIYTEGEGEHTIVFLSGSGTPSPILDFKSLYSKLTDEYRIVVIEKFGYGFSDVVDTERSFDTMLREDREILEKAGIEAPFILCPHSMSGIEAILWAQEYPDEVEALIGLDMALPDAYDVLDLRGAERMERLSGLAVDMGFLRIVNVEDMFAAFSSPDLSESDKEIYRAIMRVKTCNTCIVRESEFIPQACEKVRSAPLPDIPTLMFVSDGTEVDVENWVEIEKAYAEGLTDAKVVELACGHYVHNIEQERIAEEIRGFIGSLDEGEKETE